MSYMKLRSFNNYYTGRSVLGEVRVFNILTMKPLPKSLECTIKFRIWCR